ncbi:hypothetical protein ACROYT_G041272 [Oculina patagonica]
MGSLIDGLASKSARVVDFCDTLSGFKNFEITGDHGLAEIFGQLDSTLFMSGCQDTFGITSATVRCSETRENKSQGNRAYFLQMDSGKVPVFCHMTSLGACGGGGWTLVMKIDGAKVKRDTIQPSIIIPINLPGGKTGFDNHEPKLPTYWNTPFSKICLGMKIGQQINFIVINKQAYSLYSLIADGQYRATSLGRSTWKTLIGSKASLQTNCKKTRIQCGMQP